MLSHPFQIFIFIERALLDLIRQVFIIFYCSALHQQKGKYRQTCWFMVSKLPHVGLTLEPPLLSVIAICVFSIVLSLRIIVVSGFL